MSHYQHGAHAEALVRVHRDLRAARWANKDPQDPRTAIRANKDPRTTKRKADEKADMRKQKRQRTIGLAAAGSSSSLQAGRPADDQNAISGASTKVGLRTRGPAVASASSSSSSLQAGRRAEDVRQPGDTDGSSGSSSSLQARRPAEDQNAISGASAKVGQRTRGPAVASASSSSLPAGRPEDGQLELQAERDQPGSSEAPFGNAISGASAKVGQRTRGPAVAPAEDLEEDAGRQGQAERDQLGLDQLDHLDQLDQLDHLDQLDQLDQLGLDQLDHLDQLDQLDHLDQLDQLDQLGKFAISSEAPFDFVWVKQQLKQALRQAKETSEACNTKT